jgi:hypothetical protein
LLKIHGSKIGFLSNPGSPLYEIGEAFLDSGGFLGRDVGLDGICMELAQIDPEVKGDLSESIRIHTIRSFQGTKTSRPRYFEGTEFRACLPRVAVPVNLPAILFTDQEAGRGKGPEGRPFERQEDQRIMSRGCSVDPGESLSQKIRQDFNWIKPNDTLKALSCPMALLR